MRNRQHAGAVKYSHPDAVPWHSRAGLLAASDCECSSVFETSIYCVASERWPATTGLLWQAIELLLDHTQGIKGEPGGTIHAMQRHLNEGHTTRSLHDAAHELRKTRNDFIHEGFLRETMQKRYVYSSRPVSPYLNTLVKSPWIATYSRSPARAVVVMIGFGKFIAARNA